MTDGPEDQSDRLPAGGEPQLELASGTRTAAAFAPMLAEDIKVRDFLKRKLAHASVGRVLIERPAKDARITIFSARPGVVIGKKGEEIEALKAELRRIMGVQQVHVNIEEIRKPEIDAQLIADSIAQQLEKRIMFRRAMKRAMQNAMRLGAQGIKIMSAGPPERHRDRAHRVVPRGPRAAAHAARRHRLRPGRGEDHLRRDRHQGLGLQGRDHAQGRGAAPRCRRRRRAGAAARGAGRAQARQEAGPQGRRASAGPARPRAEGDKKAAAKRTPRPRPRPRSRSRRRSSKDDGGEKKE